MNWGKTLTAAVLALCLAVVLAGCGSGASSSNSDSGSVASSTPTASTGATGSSKKKSSSKSEAKSKKSKETSSTKSSSADSGGSSSSHSGSSNAETVPDPSKLSRSTKAQVRAAFDGYTNALRNGDANYICKTAYSKEYLDLLQSKGGCMAVTNKQIAGITKYKAKVNGIAVYPDTNLVAVYADFNFTNATGNHKSNGGVYFVKVGSFWKRAVPPKP